MEGKEGGDRGKGEAIEGKGVIKGKEYDRGEGCDRGKGGDRGNRGAIEVIGGR